jgi:hypothetical protein
LAIGRVGDAPDDFISWTDGWVGARDRLTVDFTTSQEFVRDHDKFVDYLHSRYNGI